MVKDPKVYILHLALALSAYLLVFSVNILPTLSIVGLICFFSFLASSLNLNRNFLKRSWVNNFIWFASFVLLSMSLGYPVAALTLIGLAFVNHKGLKFEQTYIPIALLLIPVFLYNKNVVPDKNLLLVFPFVSLFIHYWYYGKIKSKGFEIALAGISSFLLLNTGVVQEHLVVFGLISFAYVFLSGSSFLIILPIILAMEFVIDIEPLQGLFLVLTSSFGLFGLGASLIVCALILSSTELPALAFIVIIPIIISMLDKSIRDKKNDISFLVPFSVLAGGLAQKPIQLPRESLVILAIVSILVVGIAYVFKKWNRLEKTALKDFVRSREFDSFELNWGKHNNFMASKVQNLDFATIHKFLYSLLFISSVGATILWLF